MEQDLNKTGSTGSTQKPGETTKRPHTSATAIDTYTDRCAEMYRRRYILREFVPPSTPMVKGSAIHAGAEVNFKQKIETHADLSSSKIQEVTAAAFDERIKAEGFFPTTEEQGIGTDIVLGRAKDRAVVLADIYAKNVAPAHQPVMVEEFQRIRLNDELDLLARLDVVNDKQQIVDIKSSKKSWSQGQVDNNTQFTIYSMVFRALTGKDPAGIVAENVVDAPKNPKHSRLETTRGQADYKKLVEKINIFLAGVKLGVFLPAAKGSWYCNEEYCGYARSCKYFQYYQRGGGKIPVPFWMKRKKKKEIKK